jgi:hypothetical protein
MKPAPDTRKHQGLIISGVIIASLMLLFVLGTAAFTSIKIKTRKVQRIMDAAARDIQQSMTDSVTNQEGDRPIDYSMVFTEESLRMMQERNTDNSTTLKQKLKTNGRYDAQKKLNDFTTNTDLICKQIHDLRFKLFDTLVSTGDYGNSALSIAFFNTDNRTVNLLNDLKNYRDRAMLSAGSLGQPNQLNSAMESLPLDDGVGKNPNGYWDESKFYGTPENAAQYLLELEYAVRYFEADIIECYNN